MYIWKGEKIMITVLGITKLNFADEAEKAIKRLETQTKDNDLGKSVTTSQIRNMLSKINELGEQARSKSEEKLTDKEISKLQYIKMRIAYDAGRDKKVEKFVKEAKILELISDIKDSREKLDIFYSYFESLVAYHRFYGGKDYRR